MDTGSTRICVVPRSGGGWELRETRDGPVLERPMTKSAAVARATTVLERGRGGQIVVLGPDGAAQQTLVVAPGPVRPWSYVPRRLFPVVLGFQLVLRVVASAFDRTRGPTDLSG